MRKSTNLLNGEVRDLSQAIPYLNVAMTPFLTWLLAKGVEGANSTKIEWREQELGSVESGAQLEGGEFVEDTSTRELRDNLMEIFRKKTTVTGTLDALYVDGIGKELNLQTQQRLLEMKKDLNNKLITGTKATETGSVGRQMDGIMNLIGIQKECATPGTLTVEDIDGVFQTMYEHGYAGEKAVFVSANMQAKINALLKVDSTISITNGVDQILGIGVSRLVGSFGVANIMVDPSMPNDTMVFVDGNYAKLRALRPFQAKALPSTTDAISVGLVGEYSLEYGARNSGAILTVGTP